MLHATTESYICVHPFKGGGDIYIVVIHISSYRENPGFSLGNTTSVLNLVMEKIGEAFLWLKSKIEDGLGYLSNVTTKCLSDARRFSDNFAEGFKEKLAQSKRSIDETIEKVADILRNFPKNIVTNLIQVKDLVASMVRLMSKNISETLKVFFGCMSELWKKVKINKCMDQEFAEVLCKVKDLCTVVEGFLELLEILLPFHPVSVVILVMEVVLLYSKFPNMTVSEMKEFKNFPEGKGKAAVFVYVFIQFSSSLLYDKVSKQYH